MLTGKERAALRAQANQIETILHVGKEGVTPTVVKQAGDALAARELIKGRVLETSPTTVQETAQMIAGRTHSEVIQTIGSRFVLYRKNPEKLKPKEQRPKERVLLSPSAAHRLNGKFKRTEKPRGNSRKPRTP